MPFQSGRVAIRPTRLSQTFPLRSSHAANASARGQRRAIYASPPAELTGFALVVDCRGAGCGGERSYAIAALGAAAAAGGAGVAAAGSQPFRTGILRRVSGKKLRLYRRVFLNFCTLWLPRISSDLAQRREWCA